MNYTVIWLPDAENELAAIWLASNQRTAVTRAASELDRLLMSNPLAEGESRPDERRITFMPPLAILFRVYEDTATVTVTRVWEYR